MMIHHHHHHSLLNGHHHHHHHKSHSHRTGSTHSHPSRNQGFTPSAPPSTVNHVAHTPLAPTPSLAPPLTPGSVFPFGLLSSSSSSASSNSSAEEVPKLEPKPRDHYQPLIPSSYQRDRRDDGGCGGFCSFLRDCLADIFCCCGCCCDDSF